MSDEPIQLYVDGYEYAKQLIENDMVVLDKGDWGEVNPGTAETDEYIESHGYEAYSLWHLGIRPDYSRDTKEAWSFPYGDFQRVHRAGLKAAEERARQYGYEEVRQAAQNLLDMLPPED